MTISQAFKDAFFMQQTDEVPLLLLTIDHDDLPEPIRVVNNYENITSNSIEYIGFPFEIVLPDEDMKATISICNVDRQIVAAIRSISSPPDVTLSLVLASQPDSIEVGPYSFKLSDTSFDAFTVNGTLSFDDFLDEPYPGDTFSPGQFPGLF